MSQVQWTAYTCIENVGVRNRAASKNQPRVVSGIYNFDYTAKFTLPPEGSGW